jgi:hypothetical protein
MVSIPMTPPPNADHLHHPAPRVCGQPDGSAHSERRPHPFTLPPLPLQTNDHAFGSIPAEAEALFSFRPTFGDGRLDEYVGSFHVQVLVRKVPSTVGIQLAPWGHHDCQLHSQGPFQEASE